VKKFDPPLPALFRIVAPERYRRMPLEKRRRAD
jgi:hypothetical protein